jgi:pullulanase/glycogen debranching enzyme
MAILDAGIESRIELGSCTSVKALDCDDATRGQPVPLGASVHGSGVNFAVFSRHATGAQLLLFEPKHLSQPARALDLDCECHPTAQRNPNPIL